jgi:hypothetical protein
MNPAFASRILPPPKGALSRPLWLASNLGEFALFHDAGMLYACLSDGRPAWHIKARIAIVGFAVTDDNLYLLDGDVLCQYDANALQTPEVTLPINAISFRTAVPSGWTYQSRDDNGFDGLFEAALPTSAPTYSAPVIPAGDSRIHVLSSDGTVFSALLNLQDAIGTIRIQATRFVPDNTMLYQAPSAGGPPLLCWISGGKIASLLTGELEPAPDGLEAWRWNCIKTSVDQPWQSFAAGFISATSLGNGPAAAIMLHDPKAAQWTFHLVEPACHPVFSSDAAMLVEASGKVVSHANPGIPGGLATSLPPANAHERAGTVKGNGGAAIEIACAPYLREEDGILFAYVIAADANGPSFCKYHVPGTSDDFITEWWQNLQQARTRLDAILASEIMYSLADASQQAIDNKTLSAAALAKATASPLWSATAQGIIPWAAFDHSVPNYVTLVQHAVFMTPIDMAFQLEASIEKLVDGRNRIPQQIFPLYGPYWMSDGQSEFAVLCNMYGFHGFASDGTLAWRVQALTFFNWWTAVGRSIWVLQGSRIAQFDISTIPRHASASVPNACLDVPGGTLSQGSPGPWVDYIMTHYNEPSQATPGQEITGLVGPVYDSSTHRIRMMRVASSAAFIFSAELDATGAVAPSPAGRDPEWWQYDRDSLHGPIIEGPQGDDWRPMTGPLPEGILEVGGNPPGLVLQNVASLQLNTADNQVVQMSGTPFFRAEGSSWFLYACLKKADLYFFAKFAIPN